MMPLLMPVLVVSAIHAQAVSPSWDPPNSPTVPMQAAPSGGVPAAPPPPLGRWYGSVTLAIDVAALGVGTFMVVSHHRDALLAPALAYTLGGPIVHGAHRQGARAVTSLAMRTAAWMLGGAYMVAQNIDACGLVRLDSTPCTHDSWDGSGVLLGGMALVSVVDVFMLSRERALGPEPVIEPAPSTARTLTPLVQVAANQTIFSLGGQF